jgi:ribosomal protein L3 glutamine methyltransferase
MPLPIRSAALVVNAKSRKGRRLFKQASAAMDALPYPVDAHAVDDPKDLEATVTAALAKKPDLLILGGGDGTISGLVDLMVGHKVILGVLPLGTANSFARTLELPLDSEAGVMRRRLSPAEQDKLARVLRRRLEERVPAAYLTREAFLGEHRFYVDERVIIPRSYFLEIIPEQLASWLPAGQRVRHVVDVCTGSGCLAILLAHQFPEARVDAIDLSPDALAVARINVDQHDLAARVKLHHSDVFDTVPPALYDVILSNPPYEPTAHVDAMPAEFHHEPRMSLDGGDDGLDIVRKLLLQARDRLQPHGVVLLEVGGLREAMDRAYPELDLHWLHTHDGSDCVCVISAARLRALPRKGARPRCSQPSTTPRSAGPRRTRKPRGR